MIYLTRKRKQNPIALRTIYTSKCFSGVSPQIQLLQREQGGKLKGMSEALAFCSDPGIHYKREEEMKKQDKAEKMFVACTDVFTELVNVLVYEGKEILTKDDVLPGYTESIYEGTDGEEHNQFRDFSMYQMAEGKVHALYNLENQSSVDRLMPLRCAGYDGAAYRSQYKSEDGQGIYPVISMVLNWGEKPWKAATTVRELIDYPVPEAAEDYLDHNKMHVFDMRFLEKEVRERFEGDARVVLDYLSDRESLKLRNQKLRNPEEVLRMLYALSGDSRYLENIQFMEEGEGKSMCDLLDEAEMKGKQKEMQNGILVLIKTCKDFGASFEETVSKLKENYSLKEEEAQKNMKLYW